MPIPGLKPRTDYFYCDECGEHVPCVRHEPGVWEIQCPRCAGECALCQCHLAGSCFGQGTPIMIVRAPVADAGKRLDPKR